MKRMGVSALSGKGLRLAIVASMLLAGLAPAGLVPAGGTGTFPPPAAGDWTIEDTTSVTGENLLVGGNISIGHGSLSLTDCVISGNASKTTFFIELSENGTLNAVNCTFRTGNSTDMVLRLRGQASFRSCKFLAQGGPIWMYRYTGSVSLIDSVLEGTFEVKPGNTPTLENLTVRNAYFGMMNPYPVAGVTFENCTLGLFAGTNNTVTNCSFYDCEKGVAPGKGTVVQDCAFASCKAGVSSKLESNTFEGPWIVGCRFFDCHAGGVLGDGAYVDGCEFTGCWEGVELLGDGDIEGSAFRDCTAGVVLSANTSLTLNTSRFSACPVAVDASSAIAPGRISGCMFTRPTAGNQQDASLVSAGTLVLRDSDFKGSFGKDIRVVSGTCTAVNTTIRLGAVEVVSGFLAVCWYLDGAVHLGDGTPAASASVNISDQYGLPMVQAITGTDGSTGVLEPMQYRVAPGGTTYRSPLRVNASLGPFKGNATVDLTGNKHVGITLADVSLPWVQVISPANGSLLNTSQLRLEGTAGDESGPVASVSVRLDGGAWVPAEGNDSWTASLNATDGVHHIQALATDEAGNTGYENITLTVDTVAPAITFIWPAQGALLNRSAVQVRIRTEGGALATLGGSPADNLDGNVTVNLTLKEGLNELEVTATDPAGNRASAMLRLTLDTTPPALSVGSPANGSLVANTTVTVSGAIEAGSKLFAQGKAAAVNGTSFSYVWSLVEGENALTLYAEDAAGNRNYATLKVRRDTIAPGLTADVADGFKTKNASIGINGTTEPNATVTVNGVQVSVDASGRFFTTVQLVLGSNNITLEAKDPAGNARQLKLSVIRSKPAAPPEKKSGMETGIAALAALAAAAALVFWERRRAGAG